MASYSSVDFALSRRRLPRSQREQIPGVDDGDSASSDGEAEAGSLNAGSLRANFIAPGTDFGAAADAAAAAARYGGAARAASPFFSPVFAHLPAVDPGRLRVRSEAVQKTRRQLLRGSSVLIVQGGYSGKKFIYDRLKELGVEVTIMDGPDTIWRTEAEAGAIADFIPLDFSENETIFERAMEAIEEDDASRFDAVTSFFEDAIPLVARMATALGLEANPVDACEIARNKRRSREVMARHGLPVPKFLSITKPEHVAEACRVVGFPAIIKPVFGAASMGVVRVDSADAAEAAYREIMATLKVENDTIWAQGTELVMEEYYDGEEFDIDILLSEGKCVYAKVSDNWDCMAPWFQELGTNCPSLYPEARQRELEKLSVDTCLAFGFSSGCFHVECKYTSRGPRMIEVNARMGGVSVRDANLIAWGVDMVEEHVMCALRIPIAPVVPDAPLKFMAETCINCPYSGTIVSDTWLDHGRAHPDVWKITYMKKAGDKVVGADENVPDWLAEIIVVSTVSQEHAIGVVRDIVEKAGEPPIEPKEGAKKRPFFFPSDKFPFVPVEDVLTN